MLQSEQKYSAMDIAPSMGHPYFTKNKKLALSQFPIPTNLRLPWRIQVMK